MKTALEMTQDMRKVCLSDDINRCEFTWLDCRKRTHYDTIR